MSELPTLERFLVFTALVTLFAGTMPAPTPKPVIFRVGGRSFSFAERDVGALAHCPKQYGHLSDIVGLALLDQNGRETWSINVIDSRAVLRRELTKLGKCLPQVAHARIEGVAIVEGEAHFVVSILACGASCAGRYVEAFRFDGQRVGRPSTVKST